MSEIAIESGPPGRQAVAVAAQQANAKGVKRREYGEVLGIAAAEQLVDALTHFAGGFVGEGHRENGPGGDVIVFHQVRDAVGDDPGFAAAGAG